MISIPKKVEYSVLLISNLARSGGKTVSLRAVAKEMALPYRFLGQLAGFLKRGGILESKEGIGGGYKLKKGWKEKSFYDLVATLKEDKHLVKCLKGNAVCKRSGKCSMQPIWKKLEDSFVGNLKELKLSQV